MDTDPVNGGIRPAGYPQSIFLALSKPDEHDHRHNHIAKTRDRSEGSAAAKVRVIG